MSQQFKGKKAADEAYRDPDGYIHCACPSGELAIELTVKKEGPNHGKKFYKCGNQGACSIFVWEHDAHKLPLKDGKSLGQPSTTVESTVYEEPRPLPRSAAAKAAADRARANHVQLHPPKRRLDQDDDDDVFHIEESPTKRKAVDFIQDEIEHMEEELHSMSETLASTTDESQSFSFTTPIKKRDRTPATSDRTAYDDIKADPTSPFHERHATLFRTPSAATTMPETPSSVSTSLHHGDSPVDQAMNKTKDLGSLLEQIQKEQTKKDRLLSAAVKERDLLRHDVVDKLKRENNELKGKVKLLEDQIEDMKLRFIKR